MSGITARGRRIVPVLQAFLLAASMFGLASCFGADISNLLVKSTKLTPANPTIAVGATQQFVLSLTYLDGTTDAEPPTNTAWFTDNAAVATISTAGIATAVGAGTAQIEGSFQGNHGYTVLTVTAAPADVASAVVGNSRMLQVTNLRTGQQLTFAANGLNDSVSVTRGGAGAGAAESEISVAPERGPAWIAVDPAAKFLYVVNRTSETVSGFAIDWKTGTIEPMHFSPFAAGARPVSVEVSADGASVAVTHLQSDVVTRFAIDAETGALSADPRQ